MEIRICKDRYELGKSAAKFVASLINAAIAEKGSARIVLSTGASQFDTLASLITQPVDWTKVEMFHLDEYIDLPETHPASFRKYLKEKFTSLVPLKAAHFVDGTKENIAHLSRLINEAEIDVGLIGIGENSHIAFNDPPADFDTDDPYIVVNLNDTCKLQQVGEGWFAALDDVPKQAVSMSCRQIMKCRHIVSCVPYSVKANAVKLTLESELSNTVPATLLKTHENFTLYIDSDSASLLDLPVRW
ncbi:MAG: 6-phosphogluconolactonase [Clostridia bacterium]|nr:6-phosphogluconolactonase [Clostridia bacterium]